MKSKVDLDSVTISPIKPSIQRQKIVVLTLPENTEYTDEWYGKKLNEVKRGLLIIEDSMKIDVIEADCVCENQVMKVPIKSL